MPLKRGIMMTLAACVALPLAAALGALWLERGDMVRQQAETVLKTHARSLMAGMDEQLAEGQSHLKTWGALPTLQEVLINDEGGDVAKLLSGLQQNHAQFSSLTVTDARGRVVTSTDASLRNANLATAPGIQQALSGRPTQTGMTRLQPAAAEAVSIIVPIVAFYDRQTVIGTLAGVLDLKVMAQRAAAATRFHGGKPLVILARADSGEIIFSSRKTKAAASSLVALAAADKVSPSDLRLGEETGIAIATRSLAGQKDKEDAGLVAVAFEPWSAGVSLLGALPLQVLLVAALAVLVSVAIAWRGAKALVALHEDLSRLAAGGRAAPARRRPRHAVMAPLWEDLDRVNAQLAASKTVATARLLAEARAAAAEQRLRDVGDGLKAHIDDIANLVELINRANLAAAGGRPRAADLVELNRVAIKMLLVIRTAVAASSEQAPADTDAQRLSA